jgi:hypothetical protein
MFSNLLRFKQKKEAPIERAGGQRSSYPWTKLFIAAQHLKNTRMEDIYCNFAELEGRIRCEWGRLEDDAISGYESRRHFLYSKGEREIPRANSSHNS